MLFDYNFRNYNYRVVIYMLILSIIGVLIIRSASPDDGLAQKQIVGLGVSLTAALVLSLIDYHRILRCNILIYAGCVLLLLAVLLFGKNVNGATRWLEIWKVQIQPSEFVKIGLIMIFANFLGKYHDQINRVKILGMAAALALVPIGLIYKQPNLSTSLVTIVVVSSMVYVAGLSYRWIGGALAVGVPVGGLMLYLAPGSYTHLDVYKRQGAFRRPPRRGSGGEQRPRLQRQHLFRPHCGVHGKDHRGADGGAQ